MDQSSKPAVAPGPAVPQPRPWPIVGNLFEINPNGMIQSMMRLAADHGPIFQITILGQTTISLNSQALVNEVCDENRFAKKVHSSLLELRNLVGDGLFTAFNDEPNWALAHRLLMPAFGPLGVRGMFGRMLDIAQQIMDRWERFADTEIDVSDHMTRLTLDTLALCAFDYRFNSFYRDTLHPFVAAMAGSLTEASARDRRPPFVSRAMLRTRRRYEADIRTMQTLADELLAARRAAGGDATRSDLLDTMLHGRDAETGEGLSDENIRHQLVTFLIAGHETTSGLLSFAIYLLLETPAVLARARRSVDEVLGSRAPRLQDLADLRYIEQVLMEALRLWPTAPGFAVTPHEPTIIGGRYPVRPDDELLVLLPSLHRDPKVWGDDAEAFRPERFAPGVAERLPPNAWKPFGNGQRACIGRGFAMQEAQLVLAMVLQRFDLTAADPNYKLAISETLTIKPIGFRIRVRPRSRRAGAASSIAGVRSTMPVAAVELGDADRLAPKLLVLYGGNSGSSAAFAATLVRQAGQRGYAASASPMDAHAGRLPTEGAVLILTASYEGLPPDNARRFMAWLGSLSADDLAGVRYAVFGCGNRQWARTYQAIPTQADAGLHAAGATRIHTRGETDAAGDFVGGFEAWQEDLWPRLAEALGRSPVIPDTGKALHVEIVPFTRQAVLGEAELQNALVLENRELTSMSTGFQRSKRHLQIRLPAGMTYTAGDYLAILPRNPASTVARALRLFGFASDTQVVLRGGGALPLDRQVSLAEILRDYVELGQPATQRQLAALSEITRCPPDRAALQALCVPSAYEAEIASKRVSLLDILERFPAARMGLAPFLAALPATRVRQYSISSSPLTDPASCSLTVAVLDAPALSGNARHRGVASNYLAQLEPGDTLAATIRPARAGFHLPPPEIPLIMVCAGSGIAPFRGFLQERATLHARGTSLAKAILFFGCAHPDYDWLYREELLAWQSAGIVDIRMAFSRDSQSTRCRVQDRLLKDKEDVQALFALGAIIFVCGKADTLVPAVRAAFIQILPIVEPGGPALEGTFEATKRYFVDAFA